MFIIIFKETAAESTEILSISSTEFFTENRTELTSNYETYTEIISSIESTEIINIFTSSTLSTETNSEIIVTNTFFRIETTEIVLNNSTLSIEFITESKTEFSTENSTQYSTELSSENNSETSNEYTDVPSSIISTREYLFTSTNSGYQDISIINLYIQKKQSKALKEKTGNTYVIDLSQKQLND